MAKTRLPPTLADVDPSTLKDGKVNIYFVCILFVFSANVRHAHRLILGAMFHREPGKATNTIGTSCSSLHVATVQCGCGESQHWMWVVCFQYLLTKFFWFNAFLVELPDELKWNVQRSLRHEMLEVQTRHGMLKERDLLVQILNAVKLIRDDKCEPLFGERLGDIRNYVAVDVSLTFQLGEDEGWSRDVLNVLSTASLPLAEEVNTRLEQQKVPQQSGERMRRRGGPSKFPKEGRVGDWWCCDI